MLVSISWREYTFIVIIALALYYIVIGILYYRHKFSPTSFKKVGEKQKGKLSDTAIHVNESEETSNTFFQHSTNDNFLQDSKLNEEAEFSSTSNHSLQPELFTSQQKYTASIPDTDDTLLKVQNLIAELKETIATAAEKNYFKEEFILSLQHLLKKYYFIKATSYLVLINNLIASECEKYGFIQLSAEERVMLWNE